MAPAPQRSKSPTALLSIDGGPITTSTAFSPLSTASDPAPFGTEAGLPHTHTPAPQRPPRGAGRGRGTRRVGYDRQLHWTRQTAAWIGRRQGGRAPSRTSGAAARTTLTGSPCAFAAACALSLRPGVRGAPQGERGEIGRFREDGGAAQGLGGAAAKQHLALSQLLPPPDESCQSRPARRSRGGHAVVTRWSRGASTHIARGRRWINGSSITGVLLPEAPVDPHCAVRALAAVGGPPPRVRLAWLSARGLDGDATRPRCTAGGTRTARWRSRRGQGRPARERPSAASPLPRAPTPTHIRPDDTCQDGAMRHVSRPSAGTCLARAWQRYPRRRRPRRRALRGRSTRGRVPLPSDEVRGVHRMALLALCARAQRLEEGGGALSSFLDGTRARAADRVGMRCRESGGEEAGEGGAPGRLRASRCTSCVARPA